jgi:hypothetical protein
VPSPATGKTALRIRTEEQGLAIPANPGSLIARREDAYHPSASIVRLNIKCRTGLTKGCNVILIRVDVLLRSRSKTGSLPGTTHDS